MKQSEAWLVLYSTAIKVYTNSRIASGIRLRVQLYLQDKCASCPLAKKDVLHDDIEVIAPKVLTQPWKSTRIFFRQRARKYDIVEGVCLEGYHRPDKDKYGNDIFVAIPHEVGGNRVPPK